VEQRSTRKKICNKAGTEVGEKEDMWRGKKVMDVAEKEGCGRAEGRNRGRALEGEISNKSWLLMNRQPSRVRGEISNKS
jgi:hypothetical protein